MAKTESFGAKTELLSGVQLLGGKNREIIEILVAWGNGFGAICRHVHTFGGKCCLLFVDSKKM